MGAPTYRPPLTSDVGMRTLTVAIVLYQTPPSELAETLSHLSAALDYAADRLPTFSARLILIDNSPEPLYRDDSLPTSRYPLDYWHGHGNPGYGAANNLVLAELDSNYHLVLNPDVHLLEDGLYQGISHLDEHPGTVLVAPFGQGEQGEALHLAKAYPSVLVLALRAFGPAALRRAFAQRLAAYERHDLLRTWEPTTIELASGCSMLCRSNALRAVGGFDPRYFLYFEDFDLSLRLKSEGHCVYLPSMRIRHFGGKTARKGWRHLALFVRSGYRFFHTHGWRLL